MCASWACLSTLNDETFSHSQSQPPLINAGLSINELRADTDQNTVVMSDREKEEQLQFDLWPFHGKLIELMRHRWRLGVSFPLRHQVLDF